MNKLINKRAAIKAKLTMFKNYIELMRDKTEINDVEIIQLQERINKINALITDFDEIQSQIEEASEDVGIDLAERETFESHYFLYVSLAKSILNNNERQINSNTPESPSSVSNNSNLQMQNPNTNIKLPTIQLPKFDGDYAKWLEFRDTYVSLIHGNESISDIQKYHYLRASLEGGASQIIQSLEFTTVNYPIAWDALLDRYDNHRLLVHNHVKSLFSIESIAKESSSGLRKIQETTTKNLRALKQFGQPTDNWDTLIIYIISSKLDVTTLKEWENFKAGQNVPSLSDFNKFLKSRADLLETIQITQEKAIPREIKSIRGFMTTENKFTPKCKHCQAEHYIQNCPDFSKLTINDRVQSVKKSRLCLNCLRAGHDSKSCRSGTCKKCNLKHNTLLHFEKANNNKVVETKASSAEPEVSLSAQTTDAHVLLATALIQIQDFQNKTHTVRALLDSGSQSCFITESLCKRLMLKTSERFIQVVGLNNSCSTLNAECLVNIQSLHTNFSANITCFVVPKISEGLPGVSINIQDLDIPKNIKLADPTFFQSSKIDILIGARLFWDLMCIGQISLGSGNPTLQKTRLGWIISGSVKKPSSNSNIVCNLNFTSIQEQLATFWELEEVNQKTQLSAEELKCEEHFVKTTKRDPSGRFIVSIPLKNDIAKLGESFEQAKNRFLSVERKFQNKPEIKEQYTNFMSEYEKMGHMTKIESNRTMGVKYYMPHHFVLKKESITTKLRVVFDASAPTTSGFSFNNLQMTGPLMQDSLFSILIRFRSHKYVIAGDIEKMYRQVTMDPKYASLQRIVWRDSPDKPLQIFELNTVTYGTASASFLAIRCLIQLAEENKVKYPKLAEVIKSDFYVDDMLTGADSIEDAAQIARGVHDILLSGCFNLRKFYANNADILKYVTSEGDSKTKRIEFGCNENTKTLGLTWAPINDNLMYNIAETSTHEKVNKRVILSSVSQVFDPLGLLSPVIIVIKILLQKLWLERLSWDEGIPSHINQAWCDFRDELPILNELRINRYAFIENPISLELHGFSDASEKAYGGAIYIRAVSQNNKIKTTLLCAKSKVAPLKTITLPRLELSGALILARLVETVTKSLKVKFDRQVFWTDSTIVLGWLKTEPNKLKTFISNRVSEIQHILGTYQWRHVPSKENPADMLTRGVRPSEIQDATLWWQGPSWLSRDPSCWPVNISKVNKDFDLMEVKQVFKLNAELSFPIERFSNFLRLKRTTAWILRFANNCKPRQVKLSDGLSVNELNKALEALIRISQNVSFAQEIQCLLAKGDLPQKSRILSLNPFLDSNRILRVGGRLKNAQLPNDKKHPILLCSKQVFTKLLFTNEHKRLLHCGPQQLLASIRETYWPLLGRNLARGVIRQCVPCFRCKPRAINPIMGQLPKYRVQQGPPFSTTGIDYAGPFNIKDRKGRGSRFTKCYIGVFVCFATKAIHLELISDLTKDSFIMSLKRFVSRRGIPIRIFSDNGTNFVSAHSELKELGKFLSQHEVDISNHFISNNIDWQFVPPYSPHFGGLWEAGVKSTKVHLKRVMGNANLTFEELNTLLIQIEAVLNSRPLFPLSPDPEDLSPLTPAHFLIGRPLVAVPDPDFTEIPLNRLSRYQHIQQCQQHFWTRWHKEYIVELQQRTKWKLSRGSLKEGSMVVIKVDNAPPLHWKLGRVVKLHPGSDSVSRVATVKTASGEVKRSFAKLCPLPEIETVGDVKSACGLSRPGAC